MCNCCQEPYKKYIVLLILCFFNSSCNWLANVTYIFYRETEEGLVDACGIFSRTLNGNLDTAPLVQNFNSYVSLNFLYLTPTVIYIVDVKDVILTYLS